MPVWSSLCQDAPIGSNWRFLNPSWLHNGEFSAPTWGIRVAGSKLQKRITKYKNATKLRQNCNKKPPECPNKTVTKIQQKYFCKNMKNHILSTPLTKKRSSPTFLLHFCNWYWSFFFNLFVINFVLHFVVHFVGNKMFL